jgi:ubiquinone/menaquinone biosynthesis C-methylase UbiE
MEVPDPDTLVREQVAYYRAVASDYDEFDKRDRTQIDRPELEDALAGFDPGGDVLEIAGGTGAWTLQLAKYAGNLTVVDVSAETLAINRAKTARTKTPVDHVVADIFDWRPEQQFDVVFFSFWLTHVPPARFDGFWRLVEQSLLPGGRVFFIDNARPVLEANDHDDHVMRDHPDRGVSVRRLSDGRQYNIVKVYWQPDALRQRLANLGFDIYVRETAHRLCIYGHGTRQPH